MTKASTGREALIKAANLVRPAIATKDYIPALTHIRFSDDTLTAYNDLTAIQVSAPTPFKCCVPGELLIRALASFGGEELLCTINKDGSASFKAGRASVKLPTLPLGDFPLQWPSDDEGDEVKLDASVVRAIERCLISVGDSSGHPALMGVTLDTADGKAVLYSTDNFTISRCATNAKMKLPGDVPVILPKFFCEQLVSLSKAFPDAVMTLVLTEGAVHVEFGDFAKLLTRVPVDITPLDYPRIVNKHTDLANIKKQVSLIPNEFDAALGRALLVLGGEVVKKTEFNVSKTKIEMVSTSGFGDADDSMGFEADEALEFNADAALLARGAKAAAMIAFTSKVTIMTDADCNFVHIIAHIAD